LWSTFILLRFHCVSTLFVFNFQNIINSLHIHQSYKIYVFYLCSFLLSLIGSLSVFESFCVLILHCVWLSLYVHLFFPIFLIYLCVCLVLLLNVFGFCFNLFGSSFECNQFFLCEFSILSSSLYTYNSPSFVFWFLLGILLIPFCAHLVSPFVFRILYGVFMVHLCAHLVSQVVCVGSFLVCFLILFVHIQFPFMCFASSLVCSWTLFVYIRFLFLCFGSSLTSSYIFFVHIWFPFMGFLLGVLSIWVHSS
jgi:hypothetical protein